MWVMPDEGHLYGILCSLSSSYTKHSRSLAFPTQVTMADRSAADRACKDPNPIIDGRKANVNLAYLGAKPRVMQPGKGHYKNQNAVRYDAIWLFGSVELVLLAKPQTRKSGQSLIFTSGISCVAASDVRTCQEDIITLFSLLPLFYRLYFRHSSNSPCIHPKALWVSTMILCTLCLNFHNVSQADAP